MGLVSLLSLSVDNTVALSNARRNISAEPMLMYCMIEALAALPVTVGCWSRGCCPARARCDCDDHQTWHAAKFASSLLLSRPFQALPKVTFSRRPGSC
jgi:hypothetical protein